MSTNDQHDEYIVAAATRVVEERQAPMHSIRWTFYRGSVRAEAICHGKPGDDCRLTSVSCECEEWGEIRRDEDGTAWHRIVDGSDTEPQWHEVKPQDDCNVSLFINESGCVEELGHGSFVIAETPIEPIWEGEGYDWKPIEPTPHPEAMCDGTHVHGHRCATCGRLPAPRPEHVPLTDEEIALIDWREHIGVTVFHAIGADCHHDGEDFGDGAVCAKCWDATQRVCRAVEADRRAIPAAREQALREEPVIDAAHIDRQRTWSRETFGPHARTAGVLAHIRKELDEVAANPGDVTEWADVIILAIDGAWRAGHEPRAIIDALIAKQAENEARTWPDWRTARQDQPIEHVRGEIQ